MSDKLDRYDERAEELLRLQTRDVALREGDVATYPERMRAARHHEVLCLVLKELVRDDRVRQLDTLPGPTVAVARAFADLAYPPPKAEP